MARRRNYNRRRRGRFGFLYKLLSVFVVCGVIVVALTLFFRVDTIAVSGESRYTKAEIIQTAGVEPGDNLVLLNKPGVAARLRTELPYIYEVRINRVFPDALTIEVAETDAVMAVVQDGAAWLVSPRGSPPGKIVAQCAPAEAAQVGRIEGCELLAPSVASFFTLPSDRRTQQQSVLALMTALDEAGMLDQVQSIHLDDLTVLTMDYAERFRVELPYGADYAYKLQSLRAIVDSGQIQTNASGTIRMTREDGRSVFIED